MTEQTQTPAIEPAKGWTPEEEKQIATIQENFSCTRAEAIRKFQVATKTGKPVPLRDPKPKARAKRAPKAHKAKAERKPHAKRATKTQEQKRADWAAYRKANAEKYTAWARGWKSGQKHDGKEETFEAFNKRWEREKAAEKKAAKKSSK